MAIVEFGILFLVVLSLIYFQAPVILWTITIAILLAMMSVYGSAGAVALIIVWVIFLAAALFAILSGARRKIFTAPIVQILKARMPAISNTEREAIDAGDVWWDKDLFCGRPDWKKFLSVPKAELTQAEQSFLDNEVETLCNMIDDWKIVTEDHDLTPETWTYLKENRFFGLVIPEEYGGRGFSALAHSTIVTKIATRSISTAVNTMVPNSLGPGELVLHYGTSEQKEYYLPRLARGEEIPCFALTGPEAGSDAGAITDTGIVCRGNYEGKDIIGIRLSWDKRYITLAPIATVLGLAFRLYDPEHLLGDTENIGITLCLLPTNHPGVEIGNRHLPMHLAFMNGPTRGKDVFIPLDWIIGGVARKGQGWRMLMECLSIGRSISLPALGTACGKLSYRITGAYAAIRQQFNTPIARFEGIEEVLGDIAGMTYTLEACRQLTCGALDQGINPSIISAIAKYHMTQMARKIVDHAMDVHAGQMIQVGPRNLLAHAHIGIPICITVEGANILTRNLIIFGQGAIRCHPYILHEVELFALPSSAQNIKQLDKLIMSHIGYALSNLVRSFFAGVTGGLFFRSPVKGKTARYYKQLSRMSTALALLSDMCMLILGGNLKRKERISARLGDILSELYLASSILKYYQDQGRQPSDLDTARFSVEKCLHRIQMACDELFHNFPIKFVGKIMQFLIFPFGRAYKRPSDVLYHKVVSSMLVPSDLRTRLTQYCYLESDPIKRLDELLQRMPQIEPILKKFQKFVRSGTVPGQTPLTDKINAAENAALLTKDEARGLREYYALYHEIIAVDEFSFDLKTVIT